MIKKFGMFVVVALFCASMVSAVDFWDLDLNKDTTNLTERVLIAKNYRLEFSYEHTEPGFSRVRPLPYTYTDCQLKRAALKNDDLMQFIKGYKLPNCANRGAECNGKKYPGIVYPDGTPCMCREYLYQWMRTWSNGIYDAKFDLNENSKVDIIDLSLFLKHVKDNNWCKDKLNYEVE